MIRPSVAAIARVDILTADLPFRLSFGHALAERRSSTNVYVRVTLDDGEIGYGEGVPREYVTGETVEGAVAALGDRFAPPAVGRQVGLDELERPAERGGDAPEVLGLRWIGEATHRAAHAIAVLEQLADAVPRDVAGGAGDQYQRA